MFVLYVMNMLYVSKRKGREFVFVIMGFGVMGGYGVLVSINGGLC